MAAAVKAAKPFDNTYDYKGVQPFSTRKWYTAGNISPTKGVWVKFTYPCPLPTLTANAACSLPVDRPAVQRTIKV
jgi:hypothetical protein